MPERDVCLVVPASYWFEMQGERPDPELGQVEYKLRCRIIAEGSLVLLATICELADSSGRFREVVPARVERIPKSRILREESWVRKA